MNILNPVGPLHFRYLPPAVRPRRIAVCRPDSLAGTNQGPMGEDIEPMIDQEMFLQMMESMDKDGDGTVTKASHTPHARAHALVPPHAHMRELIWVACTRGPAARVWSSSAHERSMAPPRAPPSAARLPWAPACAPCVAPGRWSPIGGACDQTASDKRPVSCLVPAWWPVKTTGLRSL